MRKNKKKLRDWIFSATIGILLLFDLFLRGVLTFGGFLIAASGWGITLYIVIEEYIKS